MKKTLSFEIGELYQAGEYFYAVVGVIHDDERVFGHLLNETGLGRPKEYEHKFSEVVAQYYKL